MLQFTTTFIFLACTQFLDFSCRKYKFNEILTIVWLVHITFKLIFVLNLNFKQATTITKITLNLSHIEKKN